VVDPNYDLLTAIRQENSLKDKAKVVIERKDNIYKVNPDVEIIYI